MPVPATKESIRTRMQRKQENTEVIQEMLRKTRQEFNASDPKAGVTHTKRRDRDLPPLNQFDQDFGSKLMVYRGVARRTTGGLMRDDLWLNPKTNKVGSRLASMRAHERMKRPEDGQRIMQLFRKNRKDVNELNQMKSFRKHADRNLYRAHVSSERDHPVSETTLANRDARRERRRRRHARRLKLERRRIREARDADEREARNADEREARAAPPLVEAHGRSTLESHPSTDRMSRQFLQFLRRRTTLLSRATSSTL